MIAMCEPPRAQRVLGVEVVVDVRQVLSADIVRVEAAEHPVLVVREPVPADPSFGEPVPLESIGIPARVDVLLRALVGRDDARLLQIGARLERGGEALLVGVVGGVVALHRDPELEVAEHGDEALQRVHASPLLGADLHGEPIVADGLDLDFFEPVAVDSVLDDGDAGAQERRAVSRGFVAEVETKHQLRAAAEVDAQLELLPGDGAPCVPAEEPDDDRDDQEPDAEIELHGNTS
jgi:hypothetical protein